MLIKMVLLHACLCHSFIEWQNRYLCPILLSNDSSDHFDDDREKRHYNCSIAFSHTCEQWFLQAGCNATSRPAWRYHLLEGYLSDFIVMVLTCSSCLMYRETCFNRAPLSGDLKLNSTRFFLYLFKTNLY